MGEENNIFSGASRLFFAPKDTADFKELPIVENSTVIGFDEGIEIPTKPLKIEPLTFKCDLKSKYAKDYLKMLDKDWESEMEPMRKYCDAIWRNISLMIESKPRINRPKNLKYPNKKRAKRIWNKWRNRFGVTPIRRTVIPKAILSVTLAFRNNQAYYDIEAVVEKGDLDAERK